MEAVRIKLTSSSMAHGRFNISPCGRDFFPADAFGSPSRDQGTGVPIRLHPTGLQSFETDLPCYRSGGPRWIFRDRAWVRRFCRLHQIDAGDEVTITRLSDRDYRISPVFKDIRFIDLFAGIGGTRLGFEAAGGQCVFSCEWDKHSQKTYLANHGDEPAGDIRTVDAGSIPDHDILIAGFPCQPFSIAGVSKKNAIGQEHGFRCKTQGTLFFEIARILEEKQPRAFLLENVKNLTRHDKGKTFQTILETLEGELGYQVTYQVIDAAHVVPQHRERVFIVGSKPGLAFEFPTAAELANYRHAASIKEILLPRVPAKYTLTDHLWNYLQAYKERHSKAGNGFGFGMVDLDGISRTISARYYKDGAEILIPQGRKKNPRRLTPREAARLMGFPDRFEIPVSDTQAYRQFGNSVVVPVIAAIAEKLVASLRFNRVGIPAGYQQSIMA